MTGPMTIVFITRVYKCRFLTKNVQAEMAQARNLRGVQTDVFEWNQM
jgi:hypothetical protein